jgi:Ser/Thr protein kinase RdoA (MazF antagonist)
MELCDKTLEEFIKDLQNHKFYLRINPQIIHMDLHSGNILLKKQKYSNNDLKIEVKLSDFGLAKICELAQK